MLPPSSLLVPAEQVNEPNGEILELHYGSGGGRQPGEGQHGQTRIGRHLHAPKTAPWKALPNPCRPRNTLNFPCASALFPKRNHQEHVETMESLGINLRKKCNPYKKSSNVASNSCSPKARTTHGRKLIKRSKLQSRGSGDKRGSTYDRMKMREQ